MPRITGSCALCLGCKDEKGTACKSLTVPAAVNFMGKRFTRFFAPFCHCWDANGKAAKKRNESEDLPGMLKKDSRLREKGQEFSNAAFPFIIAGFSAGCSLFSVGTNGNTLGLKRFFLFFFTSLSLIAQGQNLADTTITVGEAEIVAYREKVFNAGTHSWKLDSSLLKQYSANTLGDLLAQQSGIFVRSYSPGTLATPLMRGTYGIYTAVVWNGFNLQSPMNHLADLNLIPAFFIDAGEIGYGSHSALYGSGAIGGTISFGQTRAEKEGFHGKILAGAGGFEGTKFTASTFQQGLKLSYKKKWYTGRVRYFNNIAQNNYEYINKAKFGMPRETLSNAQWWSNAQMIENYFTLRKNITASLHGWHTKAYRGVAPLMTQQRSVAFQQDDVWRVMGDIKLKEINREAVFRFTYFDERIRYTDAGIAIPIASDNRAFGLVLEAESRYKIKKHHQVSVGLNNSNYKSRAIDYGSPPPVQYRTAIFVSHRYTSKNKKLGTSITLRQEIVSLRNTEARPLVGVKYPGKLKVLPFIPSAGVDWNFYRAFWVQGKVSRIYRYPHFNDLYWTPGGNPNLKPESGYSTEASLAWKRKRPRYEINMLLGGYYNNINNWILWQQGFAGIWSPTNIQQVKARGIETQADAYYVISKISYLKADIHYTYTVSTNEKRKYNFDESYKKQLVYVPYNIIAVNVSAGYKKVYLRLNGQYTGKQFTSADNLLFLPGFYTVNAFTGISFPVKKYELELALQAKNLTNKAYSVVEWVPMPGRNYLLSLQLNF